MRKLMFEQMLHRIYQEIGSLLILTLKFTEFKYIKPTLLQRIFVMH